MNRRYRVVAAVTGLLAVGAAAPAQTVQYRSPAGIEYRSQPDTGAIARAQSALNADPRNVDRIIQLGVAQSSARQFREAIQTFTGGLAIAPDNAMLYRWRGHRYLSVRELDRALRDLTHGLRLDSTNYGILYHLGIVRFAGADFKGAADAFARAQPRAPDAGELAGATDWLWMSLARAGQSADAQAMLDRHPDSLATTNAYARRLKLYRGEIAPDDVFTPADTTDVQVATLSFGVGNWYLVRADTARAREWFERAVRSGGWPGFGFIMSEVELRRTLSAPAQSGLAGYWRGVWVREGAALPVEFEFVRTTAGYQGSFNSDELRVAGIPVVRIQYQPPGVHFEIVGDVTTTLFDGQLRGDSLTGTFRDGQATGTFSFLRAHGARPVLREEEISFSNQGVTLSGTLILPEARGRHPAVVFVHGSGAEGRWASRFLAGRFAQNGIASLIFDKRGVGKSGGDWRTAGFEDLAGDAVSAVASLHRHPSIDSLRIGIHGHSQGGTIAPLIASRSSQVAFVIASAGAGLPMDQVEVFSLKNSARIAALTPDAAAEVEAYAGELVAVAYHGNPRDRLDSLASAYQGRSWFFEPPGPDSHYWSFSRRIANFDPITYWAQVRVPALLLYGERDQRVPAQASATRISTALLGAGAGFLTVRIFPSADHTFRLSTSAGEFVWPRSAPGYLDALISWTRMITQ